MPGLVIVGDSDLNEVGSPIRILIGVPDLTKIAAVVNLRQPNGTWDGFRARELGLQLRGMNFDKYVVVGLAARRALSLPMSWSEEAGPRSRAWGKILIVPDVISTENIMLAARLHEFIGPRYRVEVLVPTSNFPSGWHSYADGWNGPALRAQIDPRHFARVWSLQPNQSYDQIPVDTLAVVDDTPVRDDVAEWYHADR